MNPYYATGFLAALFFWVWPAFLFRNLDVHWAVAGLFSAFLFLGAGRLATEFHVRFIAPKDPPKGRPSSIAIACFAIVATGLLTRLLHHVFVGA
jgi:hypothetical protein